MVTKSRFHCTLHLGWISWGIPSSFFELGFNTAFGPAALGPYWTPISQNSDGIPQYVLAGHTVFHQYMYLQWSNTVSLARTFWGIPSESWEIGVNTNRRTPEAVGQTGEGGISSNLKGQRRYSPICPNQTHGVNILLMELEPILKLSNHAKLSQIYDANFKFISQTGKS